MILIGNKIMWISWKRSKIGMINLKNWYNWKDIWIFSKEWIIQQDVNGINTIMVIIIWY